MAEPKVFTLSQVANHKSKKDCWLVIEGMVLEVTKFLEEHPGGEEVLFELAGKDATKEFNDIGHSKAAHNMLHSYRIGVLPGYKDKITGLSSNKKVVDTQNEQSKGKEMKAFVIKDDNVSPPMYLTLAEFFVPLLVAGSYFCYSYMGRLSDIVS